MLDRSSLEAWKKIRSENTAADRCFSKRPCFLFSVDLAADTGGAATANVYDGENVDGRVVLNLAAVQSDRDHRRYDPPLYLSRGLFVDVGDNVVGVTVVFYPDPAE